MIGLMNDNKTMLIWHHGSFQAGMRWNAIPIVKNPTKCTWI